MLERCRLIQWFWLAGRVIGYNSERGPPKDHSNKVWSQLANPFLRRRFFKHFFLPNLLFGNGGPLGWLVGSSDTFLKGTTQGPSLPRLVQIAPVVSEEKIKMSKVNYRWTTKTTDASWSAKKKDKRNYIIIELETEDKSNVNTL